jgi:hypothetical protein
VDARPWLEQLRAELAKQHLPPLYVERLMSELSDHIFDSLEDPMSTDVKEIGHVATRLGAPERVAIAAAKEFRGARFCRRHPLVMFVVLPVFALPILWTACVIALVALCKWFGLETAGPGIGGGVWHWATVNAPFVVLVTIAGPIGLAAWLFCRMATKAGVSWKWTLAASLILAVIGGAAMAQVVLPGAGSKGSVMLGLSLSTHPSAAQLLQFALPLAIGAWAVFRQVQAQSAARGPARRLTA